jgi:hypothetical protein
MVSNMSFDSARTLRRMARLQLQALTYCFGAHEI